VEYRIPGIPGIPLIISERKIIDFPSKEILEMRSLWNSKEFMELYTPGRTKMDN